MVLDHVALAVTELGRALRLFEVLGYRKAGEVQVAGVQYARLEDDSSRIVLMYGVSRRSDVAESVKAHGPGPHHLGFTVPDLDAAVAKLTSLFDLEGRTTEHEKGRQWLSQREPVTGLVIELIERL